MPELEFRIKAVEPAARGLTPLLRFQVEITSKPCKQAIQSVLLQAQIRIQSPRRGYSAPEKEKLVDLFGQPEQWGQTLRERFWTLSQTIVPAFAGSGTAHLDVPCSYDLNLAATKYFYALEEGEVPLLFLFSGTVFYPGQDGRLQAQQISWNKEADFRMPVRLWHDLMDQHYPNTAWVYLNRDVFERLYAYKRSHGLATWEQTIDRLLVPELEKEVVAA